MHQANRQEHKINKQEMLQERRKSERKLQTLTAEQRRLGEY